MEAFRYGARPRAPPPRSSWPARRRQAHHCACRPDIRSVPSGALPDPASPPQASWSTRPRCGMCSSRYRGRMAKTPAGRSAYHGRDGARADLRAQLPMRRSKQRWGASPNQPDVHPRRPPHVAGGRTTHARDHAAAPAADARRHPHRQHRRLAPEPGGDAADLRRTASAPARVAITPGTRLVSAPCDNECRMGNG